MDNTGLYTSVAKLLTELANAGKATKVKLALSNKTLVSGTSYRYDFISEGDPPTPLSYLVQGDYYSIITVVAGNQITVIDGTNIDNGIAQSIKSDYTESELTTFITDAMAFIDRHTRQWFNARTFDSDHEVKIEGNNSETLFINVPIISIDKIRKGTDGENIPLENMQIFKSRTMPDDRRNPMIKLRKDSGDIYSESYGYWNRGQLIYIQGTFGFLEEDGSTPSMIQRATLKLAIIYAYKSIGAGAAESVASGDKGALKKEKTDFHEVEFYDPNSGGGSSTAGGTGLSGDDEIDDTIAAYKSPLIITGTFPDLGVERPRMYSFSGDN